MVIIERDPPPRIKGYLTQALDRNAINSAIEAFKRGAYDSYDPLVQLDLDETRFIGLDAERVRETLDGEKMEDPFIVFDGRTATDQSAWWVDRWVDKILSGDELQDWLTHDVVGVRVGTRVLIKSRRKIVEYVFHTIRFLSLSSRESTTLPASLSDSSTDWRYLHPRRLT